MIIKDTKNKKINRIPNEKTYIVEKFNHYHKIVNVKNQTVFKKKYGALGNCVTDNLGNIKCSGEKGGGATTDNMGKVYFTE